MLIFFVYFGIWCVDLFSHSLCCLVLLWSPSLTPWLKDQKQFLCWWLKSLSHGDIKDITDSGTEWLGSGTGQYLCIFPLPAWAFREFCVAAFLNWFLKPAFILWNLFFFPHVSIVHRNQTPGSHCTYTQSLEGTPFHVAVWFCAMEMLILIVSRVLCFLNSHSIGHLSALWLEHRLKEDEGGSKCELRL